MQRVEGIFKFKRTNPLHKEEQPQFLLQRNWKRIKITPALLIKGKVAVMGVCAVLWRIGKELLRQLCASYGR